MRGVARDDQGILQRGRVIPREALAAAGGFASRRELLAMGCWPDFIDLSVRYRRILPVRKGYYASVDLHPLILRALRAGGRLACTTALAWYQGQPVSRFEPVHVVVPRNASGVDRRGAVVHWTRRELEGTRTLVSEEVARWQARSCRAARTT